MEWKDHELAPLPRAGAVRYEETPLRSPEGEEVPGLHVVRITLDNPRQLNSYTTDMVKAVILGMRRASADRACTGVVFTGAGTRAFCTGGNTAEYAEYYAGRPEEYRQYMRLFNDMVSAILACDKPVICRVNGLRIAGGQEIGMACDFSIAQDLALFGQAGPRHGSAPDGGSTDFLPLFVGVEAAMESCTLCGHWSAHKALRLGLVSRIVPGLALDGRAVPNPWVVTDRWTDATGRIVFGEPKEGADKAAAKDLVARGTVDLAALDREVDALTYALANTMPGCLSKTLESVRKHKLERWDRNRETNRAWLALNMMTEGRLGFRAFHEGVRGRREVDFLELRRRLARGEAWGDALVDAMLRGDAVSAPR
jgi:6-oxo-cyclohex-1-ene-carbonyl-CoA hydrolase